MGKNGSRRPHPDGGPDIRTDAPLPPPFPVGTRLRMKPGPNAFNAYVQNPDLPVKERSQPGNLVRVRGVGMEVVIARVREGHRGSGRLMETQDDGYEVYDSTKDGTSTYVSTYADGREIPHSGRCIDAEDKNHWEVIDDSTSITRPMNIEKAKR